ncbi:MAG: hypothetical protein HQK75_05890 [Candidatus Magnetomorum sp.]|nr:hypothetical protein [Candidatus Magnetomorum sp.]
MKRTLMLFGVLLSAMFMTIPAYSVDHQLGGDLRFRVYTAADWSGNDNNTYVKDRSRVDSRAHLDYTAKINDDLKVYTSFRIDSVWGDDGTGGAGVGKADIKLKYSYMDFNIGQTNITIGMQDFFEARGLLLYDVAPGISITTPMTDQFTLNVKWIRLGEGGYKAGDHVGAQAHQDMDTFAITPTLKLNENIKLKPYFWYVTSNEAKNADNWGLPMNGDPGIDDLDVYYLGFDFDATMGNTSAWFTALYQVGSANLLITNANTLGSIDYSGFAVCGGGSLNIGKATLSAQFFYATGDDDENDDKLEAFNSAEAGYYYWSEIMGLGSNDDVVPNNLAWSLTNIMGGGAGASICASDKMTLDFSIWYAAAVEDFKGAQTGQTVEAADFGTELNASMSYSLMDNLSLSFLGAYVIAGDALTEKNVENPVVNGKPIDSANPYIVQAQIKAKF